MREACNKCLPLLIMHVFFRVSFETNIETGPLECRSITCSDIYFLYKVYKITFKYFELIRKIFHILRVSECVSK